MKSFKEYLAETFGQSYEPDEIDHGGKRYLKTDEMIPFNKISARKYKEKSGFKYITREVKSGKIHEWNYLLNF